MSIKFRFLGTGDVRQLPVFGCDCPACQRARSHPEYVRKPCSAEIRIGSENGSEDNCPIVLIDGGLTDLAHRYQPGQLSAIFLTHYHVDHVQGLFHLRWGLNDSIPVIGPEDQHGCADLLKHPGILDFKPSPSPFEPFQIGDLEIIPLPLQHSKPTYGYLFRSEGKQLAYLTDTVGLPENTTTFLQQAGDFDLVIDCSHPPQATPPRNHNDLNLVYSIIETLKPQHTWLTHISHEMDAWLIRNPLPKQISVAQDDCGLSPTAF